MVFVVAIAIAAAWNFTQSKAETELSDLALANVEALASCETTVGGSCWMLYSGDWKCCSGGNYGCSPCD